MTKEEVRALVDRLRARKEPSPLAPKGPRDAALNDALGKLAASSVEERSVKSALFLWNDDLAASHALAQEIETQTASYLHGVMHRREPDYENSKYWFKKVGRHPLFPAVHAAALGLLPPEFRKAVGKEWDPFRMVDWCAKGEPRAALEALQAREIELLADHCIDVAGY